MKYQGDSWNDPLYRIISEVLDEAGYQPLRSDEIPTSGPVVNEIANLIREADLVVLDSSGDSHSVSYELGFAHGCERPFTKLVHLRAKSDGPLPFNFSHYRALIYRDLKHLRRLLRERLAVSIPLPDTALGFALNIDKSKSNGAYGEEAANAVLDVLGKKKFTGRCEYYAGELLLHGSPDVYLVGLGVRPKGRNAKTPTFQWWQGFAQDVSHALVATGSRLVVNHACSEMGEMSGFRHDPTYRPRGVVEFVDGAPTTVLSPDSEASDSWFIAATRDRLKPDA